MSLDNSKSQIRASREDSGQRVSVKCSPSKQEDLSSIPQITLQITPQPHNPDSRTVEAMGQTLQSVSQPSPLRKFPAGSTSCPMPSLPHKIKTD